MLFDAKLAPSPTPPHQTTGSMMITIWILGFVEQNHDIDLSLACRSRAASLRLRIANP